MRLWWDFLRISAFVALAAWFATAFRPGAAKPPADPRDERARCDILRMIDAIERCREDIGTEGLRHGALATARALMGPGTVPRGPLDPSSASDLADLLCRNRLGLSNWHGPYLEAIPEDPWGGAYVITWSGMRSRQDNVWIVSAGPNGKLDTKAADTRAQNDDVAFVVFW